MQTLLPKTVKWDRSKKHHMAVFVMRDSRYFTAFCGDCDYDAVGGLQDLEEYKQSLLSSEDTQIVCWVETNE